MGLLPQPTTSSRFQDGRCEMTRTVIAVSVMALCAMFTVFALTMAAAYEINEHCTDKMAWDGNC